MTIFQKAKFKQAMILIMALLATQLANANFGSKFGQKLSSFNDEIVIVAAVVFVTGIICFAITMMGGGSERLKKWGIGLIFAGILIFIAPDLASFFF